MLLVETRESSHEPGKDGLDGLFQYIADQINSNLTEISTWK